MKENLSQAEKLYHQYLESVGISEEKMTPIQKVEMKKSFYAGAVKMAAFMKDVVADLDRSTTENMINSLSSDFKETFGTKTLSSLVREVRELNPKQFTPSEEKSPEEENPPNDEKSKLAKGHWRIKDKENAVFFYNSSGNYGFKDGMWGKNWDVNLREYKKTEPDEIKEILVKELERRNFVNPKNSGGQILTYKSLEQVGPWSKTGSLGSSFQYDEVTDTLFNVGRGRYVIYKKGNFAEIIK